MRLYHYTLSTHEHVIWAKSKLEACQKLGSAELGKYLTDQTDNKALVKLLPKTHPEYARELRDDAEWYPW